MRILHVSDVYLPHIGGIEVFVSDLARHQVADGHLVDVLTPTGSAAVELARQPAVLRASGPLDGLERLREGEYDVVHAHLSVLSPFTTIVARAAVRLCMPTVMTVHSMLSVTGPVVPAIGMLVGWRRWPAVWTTVSSVAAADLLTVLGSEADVHVVPNAVDVDWWRSAGPVLSPRPVTLVSVGRLAPRKRPLALVDMLREARLRVPDSVAMRAVIVGEGQLERRLQARLHRNGMTDWVSLAGSRTREGIRDLYRSADLYLAPARHESFGIAALEARAAGLPVVALSSGGVGEFVASGVDGLLCRDDAGMVAAIAGLTCDTRIREDMARHNRLVAPAHDWSRTTAGFAGAYARADGRNTVAVMPAS
jgi:phosphatidylinositol alpha 1,6-mannosyltransferase